MPSLDMIKSPEDLAGLSRAELDTLAHDIRDFLITRVSRTGGHLGPNLGVVELTIALHRVFTSPTDPIVFDTGHQSYVHKILTGRQQDFESLRSGGGISGYPSRAESAHDWVENSHASASLSWAEGMAKAIRLRGETGRTVVAVIGDGALTGGMAWEALNNIAVQEDLPLVIVVNDNGRSYTPTVGGLAEHLVLMRTDRRYEEILDLIKRHVSNTPLVGRATYDLLHAIKTGMKDALAPQGLFADLGLKYLGPFDGHDIPTMERALTQAKNFGGPVILHALTQKGHGFRAAEQNEEDRFHAIGQIDAHTGEPLASITTPTWTDTFAEELVEIGAERPDVVGITAAMLHPTGLNRFAAAYPDRTFDVGIAEQHAVTSAAGMAAMGLHPVVAVYATFLNRAFDQVLLDVALHNAGVTFVLDRAGVTGPDGASHNGVWDMSVFRVVPSIQIFAPRDAARLRQALRVSVDIDDAPTVVRFAKAKLPDDMEAIATYGEVDVLSSTSGHNRVLVVAYGAMAQTGLDVGTRLSQQGIPVTVVDPVRAWPVVDGLVDLCQRHELVVTVEDNLVSNGVGSGLAEVLAEADIATPVVNFGVPAEFLPHASRAELLEQIGLTGQDIARSVVEHMARVDARSHPAPATAAPPRS